MSVLKSKRTESKAEYVNVANAIYIETINFLTRISARYSRLIAEPVAKLAGEVIQSFTNQIQIVKTDSFCKVVIQFIDGLSADAGCAGKFRLRHAPFAETR